MNHFNLEDFEVVLCNIKGLFPHNLISNFLKTFSFSSFHLPSLRTLIFILIITLFLMKNKNLKKHYELIEFFFVIEYLTIIYVVL